MTENQDVIQAPVTGVPAIDEALASLDLSGPVSGHHDRLAKVQEALQQVLHEARRAPTGS